MPRSFQVVIDCADPERMAEFWAAALGYAVEPPPDGRASWREFQQAKGFPEAEIAEFAAVSDPDGGRVCFLGVPEGKTGKNRLHLDIRATEPGDSLARKAERVDALVERLCARGGSVLRTGRERGQYFVTMADVEGNEFCVH